MDDRELIQRYAQAQDHEAFAQLVRRHGDWVYSSARRQVGDPHLAEDVAQAVFLLFSRRARTLGSYAYLSGWLFKTLRYCAKAAIRQRSRRQHHERQAAAMHANPAPAHPDWYEISPILDEALARLKTADREAVLLRFYEQKPLAEVGRLLGITEEAARKRVDRAVDRLRERLAEKGITVETGALSAVVLTHAAEHVPADLAGQVMATIASGAGGAPAGAIVQAATTMMTLAKLKAAALAMATVTAGVAAAGAVSVLTTRPAQVQPAPVQPVAVQPRPTDPEAAKAAALVSVAVVDLQEVLTAAAQMDAERPKDAPAAAPQRSDPQQLQKAQMRTAFTLALQAANDVAISRGCDMVLNIKARGASSQPGSGPVHPCYLAESSDLTTDVIARLEARARQIEQPLPALTTRPDDHPAIATVDVRRAFSQMRHTRDLNERRRALAKETADRSAKLIALNQQFAQAAQNSPEWKDLQAKLKDAAAAYEAWQKSSQRDATRDQTTAMRDIFQEIATAAAELGRRRGCWLVLVATRPDLPEDLSYIQPDQLRSIIASTTILYSAPQADLTNELLQILDAQYTGQPVPWPTTPPTHASPLPVRIIDQAEVTRRTALSPTRLESAISPLATQRGYTLVLPATRPKLPESADNIGLDQLRTLINSFNVLYADPTADISADLIPGR